MAIYLGAAELSTGGGGGGGGFTKMNKYSTERSLNDATYKLPPPSFLGRQFTNLAIGATGFTNFQLSTPPSYQTSANEIVNGTFVHNGTTHTIATNTAYNPGTGGFDLTFTPGLTATMAAFDYVTITNPAFFTVNPATDLGLEDGASLGYFMVGSGMSVYNGSGDTGRGGKIIYGTKIITNASTDLILTPAASPPANNNMVQTESTISGGITLTTGNGYNGAGFGFDSYNTSKIRSIGTGVMGYGFGGGTEDLRTFPRGDQAHGFGGGGAYVYYNTFCAGGDGAILLSY